MTIETLKSYARSFVCDKDRRMTDEEKVIRKLLRRVEIADKIADALLEFERTTYIGTPATRELMHLVRDFKGIL